jgi:hypothetical protein
MVYNINIKINQAMKGKAMKTAIVPRHPFAEVSSSSMKAWVSEASKEDVLQEVSEYNDNLERFEKAVVKADRSDASVKTYSDAYVHASKLAAYFNAALDKIKNIAIQVGTFESDEYSLKFSVEGGKEKAREYDLDALKKDHPDVYRKVTFKNGKPMLKADRKKLDDEASRLKAELQEVNKKIIEDNANKQVYVNEQLFDNAVESDPDIANYRTIKYGSKRFQVRELKD